MAQSYDRRINLYINGREVQNNIASIRKEMYRLTNEQARMTIGSKEYQQNAAQIKRLKGIMAQHVQDISNVKKGWSMQGVADGFNRYFGMITAAMASFAGVALTIKSSVQAFAEFDDKLADVMKTTGLTKDQVKALNTELEKIDTRSSQDELLDLARVAGKLGITAEEEILGFVRAADKIKVALSEDLGGDVEESINQLGKLVDIFKLKDQFGIEDALIKIGSAINSLGAAGTANEGYMVEFAKRLAGVAPAAGISIEKVLGLAATLDELGQPTEMAGTAISQVITKMFKETATYAGIAGMSVKDFTELLETDANEAFIKLLEGARGSGTGFAELAKNLDALGLDGARSTAVLGSLADNIVKLREKQAFSNEEFEKGTSILVEFNTKNQSAQAELEKARKSFTRMQRELGEKLTPAYTGVIHKSSALLKILGATVLFLFKYGAQLAVVAATIAAYTIAVKLSTLWQTRFQSATLLAVAAQKLQALAFNAQFAAISLYNAVIALLTGKLKVATIQFRAFSAALMANPVGMVVGAVTALAGAMYLYSRRMTEAQKLQKTLNSVNLEAEKNIVEQRLQVEQLLKVAQDDNRSKADRLAAIEKLNEIAPEYYKGITLETINTDAARTATDKYIDSLRQKAKVMAAQEKLVEIEKELIDLTTGDGKAAAPTLWQQAANGLKAMGNMATFTYLNANTAAKNLVDKTKELNLQKEKLLEITEKQVNLDKNTPGAIPGETRSTTPASPLASPKEIEARNKAQLEALDQAFIASQNLLKQQYLQKETNEKEFQARMITSELAYLELKKQMLEQQGQKTVEVESQIFDKRIELAKIGAETLKKLHEDFAGEVQAYMDAENDKLDQAVKDATDFGKRVTDEQVRQKDNEKKILEDRAQNYLSLAQGIGESFEEMLLNQEISFAQFLRNTLMLALDALEKMMIMSITETTIAAIAKSGWDFTALARAFAKVVAIKAAFGAAKAMVMGGNKVQKKATGGYTDGASMYIAGEAGKEWIAPNHMLKHPVTGPIIAALENMRGNRLSPSAIQTFASGGFTSSSASSALSPSPSAPSPVPYAGSGLSEKHIADLTTAINQFLKHRPPVYLEEFEKKWNAYNDVKTKRNLQ